MNPSPLAPNGSGAHRSAGLLHWGGLQGYSYAVLSVVAALGTGLLLDHFGFRDATVPLFICASAVSSWYGGQGPAVLAVILCSLVFDFFFVRPLYTLYIAATELPYFIIFASFTLLVSWFARIRRRVEDDLRHTRDELEFLNHELAKRSSALEASNKELEAFAYSVSHDLRAPLRHVAGFGELLRNSAGPSLNEKSMRYLTVVLESASRMGNLIDDLLSFSRISRAEAHYSNVSLQQIVQESVAEARQDSNGRNIAWTVDAIAWLGHEPPNLERARAAATKVNEYGNRAAGIIDRIRSFYRKCPPQREFIDVIGVVHEMLTLLQGEAARYSAVLRSELPAELPRINADPVRLQQVFVNLMLNAIEAMKDSSGELTVRSQLQGSQILFSVIDTGVGLPTENADRIFSAFYPTKAQGSGMGLAISRTIVESHGGRLWAAASDRRGATFHFTLPTQAAESALAV